MELTNISDNEYILTEEDNNIFISILDEKVILDKESNNYIIVEISEDKSELVTYSISENIVCF